MNKKNLILDCDPGHDDAIALILALKSDVFNVLGITIESGNQTLEKTGRNALNLCQFLDSDVPVCLGANHPLIKEVEICDAIHGDSGLDGVEFPPLIKKYDKRNAVSFIIETLKKFKDVTIVTTGPMTNIALALRIDPSIKINIKEIVSMGGAINRGNVTPAAEFNINCDPEAAYIVFTSNLKVKMIGLDVTRKVLVLPSILKRMNKINNKVSDLFVALMKFFNKTQKDVFNLPGGPLHDPVTIVSLLDEKVVTFKYMNVSIDISHGESYGRTNCDIEGYLNLPSNIYVATDINIDKYWDIIENIFKRC